LGLVGDEAIEMFVHGGVLVYDYVVDEQRR